jgi:GT2 family glycosyltransferase
MPVDIDFKVSLVILTWNRWPSVYKSLSANLMSAGYPVHEIIHVDNGSKPILVETCGTAERYEPYAEHFKRVFSPSVQVLHAQNQGVARGYNRGLALATGSHVVITGCDRIMPPNWLKTWVECFNDYPATGVISCYSQYEEHTHEVSRFRGSKWHKDRDARHVIRGALPVEARMHSKAFLFETGFWREDFGLYGYEDAEWADRADATAKRLGRINYVVKGQFSRHIDCSDFGNIGGMPYSAFKRQEHEDPRKRALYVACRREGSPYYNPYARIEPNCLGEKEV